MLGGDADTYGFLMSAAGVGSFLAAISIAFGQRPTMRRVLMGAACVGIGMIGLSLLALVPDQPGADVPGRLGNDLDGRDDATRSSSCRCPTCCAAGSMSVFTTVFAGSTPIGGLISGSLAAIGGAPLAMLVGGSVAFLAAAVGFVRQPGGGQVRVPPILTRRAARHR